MSFKPTCFGMHTSPNKDRSNICRLLIQLLWYQKTQNGVVKMFFFVVNMQFNFEGNYDLVKFIKLVQEHGMFVTLRVGPFIQAEWNHG